MEHDFELFWACYPKRSGANPKAEARKVWDKMLSKGQLPPMEELLRATQIFASQCGREKITGTQFVPHARTWLNQRRFESDAAVVIPAPITPQVDMSSVLPAGYESAAKALIKEIGQARYLAFFGKAKWSNGGPTIRIEVPSAFDRQTIEINWADRLEQLTGKTIEVMQPAKRD